MPVPATDPDSQTPIIHRVGTDTVVGGLAVLLALALALWLLPTYVRTPIAPRPLAMAPWFLPSATTGLIGLAGLMLLARGFRSRALPPHAAEDVAAPRRDLRGLGGAFIALVLYPVLMPVLGALITGVVLTCALLALSRVGRSRLLPVGLLVPLVAWALFAEAIGIPLPRGWLP